MPLRPFTLRPALAFALAFAGALHLAAAPPALNKFSNLHAGAILPGASAGTATLIAPSGARSSTGGTALGSSVGLTLGSFTLTGTPGDTWAIQVTSALPFTLSRVGGGTLTVTAVDFQPGATGAFPAGGTTPMNTMGASLTVGTAAACPQGTYTGSISLRVEDTSKGGKTSPSVAFTVTVQVDPVITLSKTADLRFGDIFAGPSPGTVVLSPAGVRTPTGGLSLGSGSAVSAAGLLVAGAPHATYAILLPASATLTGPAGTLLVSTFTSSPGIAGVLSAAGSQLLAVGGTLTVAANQPDGDYAGTFSVTVIYN